MVRGAFVQLERGALRVSALDPGLRRSRGPVLKHAGLAVTTIQDALLAPEVALPSERLQWCAVHFVQL